MDHPNVFFYHEDSEEMFVGGRDYVSKLNVNDFNTIEVRAEMNSMLLSVGGRVCLCVCLKRYSFISAALAGYNDMLGLTGTDGCHRHNE